MNNDLYVRKFSFILDITCIYLTKCLNTKDPEVNSIMPSLRSANFDRERGNLLSFDRKRKGQVIINIYSKNYCSTEVRLN